MDTLSFENLNFSFLIEAASRTAYLQEWEDGAWGEPDRYSLPLALDSQPKNSKLARAVKSFRGSAECEELCTALEDGLIRESKPQPRRVWDGIAARIAELIYA